MICYRHEQLRSAAPLTDITALPLYGFQFFFRCIDHFRRSFWTLTAVRVCSSGLRFYSTFLISEILSSVSHLSSATLITVYLPRFIGAIIACELLDYATRRFGEELPYLYLDYISLRFFVTWNSLRSTRLLAISKERLQQLTLKYLEGVSTFLNDWVWRLPAEITTLVIVCALLAYQSPFVLLLNVLVMSFYFGLAFWNSRRFSRYWENYLTTSVASQSYFQNVMNQLATVQRLGALPPLVATGASHAIQAGDAICAVKKFHGYRWFLQLNFFNLVYAATFFFGVIQVIDGALPLGFLILIKWTYDSLWSVMQYAIEAYVRLIGQRENALLFNRELQALKVYFPGSVTSFPAHWQTLQLCDACAAYELDDGTTVTVTVPSLVLRPNTQVSLSGPSGCGKSSVLSMFMNLIRFEGSYELDGESVKENKMSPSSMTLVTTLDGFFPVSIRDNLTLGMPTTESEVLRILEGLQIDFVSNLDERFGAGIAFSAGQLQRLRLARGLLSQAKVILLDEPFTGIDEATKDIMCRFMRGELEGKAVVFVTHDPRELEAFDVSQRYEFSGNTVYAV